MIFIKDFLQCLTRGKCPVSINWVNAGVPRKLPVTFLCAVCHPGGYYLRDAEKQLHNPLQKRES